jgi:hypothetical protein
MLESSLPFAPAFETMRLWNELSLEITPEEWERIRYTQTS